MMMERGFGNGTAEVIAGAFAWGASLGGCGSGVGCGRNLAKDAPSVAIGMIAR